MANGNGNFSGYGGQYQTEDDEPVYQPQLVAPENTPFPMAVDQQQPPMSPAATPAGAPVSGPFPQPPQAMLPLPPGTGRTWSRTDGVLSPITNITGPVPPSDPRAALLQRQAQANDALWKQLRQHTANLPLAQTEAAVGAAMRFQGIRQYQQAIQAGIPQAEAYRRAAPMMFWQPHQSNLGQAASFLRAIAPPEPKIMDVGGTLYRVDPQGTGATALTTPKPPTASRFDTADYTDTLKQLDKVREDLSNLDMVKDQKRFNELDATRRLLESKLRDIRSGGVAGVAVAPRTGTATTATQAKKPGKPTTPQEKLSAARQLRAQHPDWTKQQILNAVNQ